MLFRMFLHTLYHIPSFIPYFISRYLSKRKENSDSNKLVTNYIYNEIPKKYKCKYLIKPLLIISLFKFFSKAPYYLFCILTDKSYQNIYNLGIYSIINAVLIYIFSYFILKTYFYKHHYLSFSINCFAFLLSLIKDIYIVIILEQKDYKYYIYIILKILGLAFRCFTYCYSKKKFEDSLLTPYSIIAFSSIYEVIYLAIFSVPFIFIPIKDYGKNEGEILFVSFSYYFTGIRLLYTILLIIDRYLMELFFMLIINKFSPSHLSLPIAIEFFGKAAYLIIRDLRRSQSVYIDRYIDLAIHFLVFIGAMIHNEIFIINRCGLNEKTQLYLNNEFKKENNDNDELINNLDENSNEEEKEAVEMSYVKRNDK